MLAVFHTFFSISGLSLLGYLKTLVNPDGVYRTIDPLYALPVDVVQRLGLKGQVIVYNGVEGNVFCCDGYDVASLYLLV